MVIIAPMNSQTAHKFKAAALFLGQVRRLATPYFQSEERIRAWALLITIVTLNLGSVYLAVLFNEWYGVFYNALQEKNSAVFWTQMGKFAYLAFIAIVVAVYKFYLTQLLEVRWRQWMTHDRLTRWTGHQAFYRLELLRYTRQADDKTSPDNPDQRLAQDISLFTSQTISLSMGLLNAVVTLFSFVGILWALSGSWKFDAWGVAIEIPGYMVWAAVLYCLAGSLLTHWIGRPLIGLNFQQEKVEADFRHHLIRVRESSESIALDKGSESERVHLSRRFGNVLANYLALIKAQKKLVWFTSFFGQAAVIFPFLVSAPRYFSGAIQLGQLIQISSAFGKVQDALSWFVDNYDRLASWRATTDRLISFDVALGQATHPGAIQIAQTEPDAAASEGLTVSDLRLQLPSGTMLLSIPHLSLQGGDRVWLQGDSGSGKSTLFRAFSGIWPHGTGRIVVPHDCMFLPQKPYIAQGSLRAALAYPDAPDRYSDHELQHALEQVLLTHLANALDQEDAWAHKLSGGEQQRLALARVFLRRPKWLFTDEATSALDADASTTITLKINALVESQQGAWVAISHDERLGFAHQKVWKVEASTIRAYSV